MIVMFLRYFFTLFLLTFQLMVLEGKQVILPAQFGLESAKNNVERYWSIYNAHRKALELGTTVSYRGIDSLEIEIPKDAKSIPIANEQDFSGLKLIVTNHSKDIYLFELKQKSIPINVFAANVDNGDFSSDSILKRGNYILILQDDNPWVENRKGHNYGHIRKDILFLNDGKSVNLPIAPYNNFASKVSAKYCKVSRNRKLFANLVFHRKYGNSKIVNLLSVNTQNNFELRNVICYTPESSLVEDHIISIYNCTNIFFKDVKIYGTYSSKDHSGYGIELNNVWNCSFLRLYGTGNWGIFGTSNVSLATFENCDINRFDIHCYGKNAHFIKCTFRDLYNQFASMYGKVVFNNCKFIDFIPIGFGKSYNAYTSFDIVIRNCSFYSPTRNLCFLIKTTGIFDKEINKRPELIKKGWPNIYIDGLKIYSKGDVFGYFYLFNFGIRNIKYPIPSKMSIRNIHFFPEEDVNFKISSSFAYFGRKPYIEIIQKGFVFLLICILICLIFIIKRLFVTRERINYQIQLFSNE